MFICDLKQKTPIIYLKQKTPTIYLTVRYGHRYLTVRFGLGGIAILPWNADICNLGRGFLVTDCMSFLQTPGTHGQNMRPKRLSNISIEI